MAKGKKKQIEMKYKALKTILDEGKSAIPPRMMFSIFLVVVLGAALAAGGFFCIYKTPLFTITGVNIADPMNALEAGKAELSSGLMRKNIFEADIKFLENLIENKHPEVKSVIVKRVLPSSIAIEVISRSPVAKIKELKYYPIDETGIVLSPDMRMSGQLPVITGYYSWSPIKVGEKLDARPVTLALELIKDFRKATDDLSISTISMGSFNNISFFIEDGPLVKIGNEKYPERLARLMKFLDDPKIDRENISYIDLRFEDIIVKPK